MKKGGAVQKSRFFIFSSVAIAIAVMALVFSANTLTPATYENGLGFSVNENITNEFNITVNNTNLAAVGNISQVNITLPDLFVFVLGTNITAADSVGEGHFAGLFTNTTAGDGTNLSWTNSTGFIINGTILNSGNWSFFTFNATTNTPGTYNFTVTTGNATGGAIETQYVSVEVNDTTAPFDIEYSTGSPATGANITTDYFAVNITSNDTDGSYAGTLDTIAYFIYYPNGTLFNNTNTTTNSDTINFTGLANGTYFINISVNDTAGNENFSLAGSRTLTVDNEKPNASAACSPATVVQGETVTCTCSGTDSFSGINSTATTPGSTPSTADTGTYSYGCTVTDYAGNTASSTVEYNINGLGGGSGGSGGSGGGSSGSDDDYFTGDTEDVSDEDFASGYTANVAPKSELKVSIDNEDHFVGVVSLTATTVKINVSSEPQQATFAIGDTRKFDVNSNNFYDLQVTLNSIDLGGNTASISILSIHEVITEDSIAEEEELEEEALDIASSSDGISWAWWIAGLIVLVIIIFVIAYLKKK